MNARMEVGTVEGYFTTAEAADELGLSIRGIRDRIRLGIMRAERVGVRGWLIPAAEVERMRGIGRLKAGRKPGSGSTRSNRSDRAVGG